MDEDSPLSDNLELEDRRDWEDIDDAVETERSRSGQASRARPGERTMGDDDSLSVKGSGSAIFIVSVVVDSGGSPELSAVGSSVRVLSSGLVVAAVSDSMLVVFCVDSVEASLLTSLVSVDNSATPNRDMKHGSGCVWWSVMIVDEWLRRSVPNLRRRQSIGVIWLSIYRPGAYLLLQHYGSPTCTTESCCSAN